MIHLKTGSLFASDPLENCHLNVKKIAKNLTYFSKKLTTKVLSKIFVIVLKTMLRFCQFFDIQMAIFRRVSRPPVAIVQTFILLSINETFPYTLERLAFGEVPAWFTRLHLHCLTDRKVVVVHFRQLTHLRQSAVVNSLLRNV